MESLDEVPQPRGVVYDLGYRNYDGPRLGRRYAIRSLYVLSLRNTFGLGRGTLPKVLAFGLALIALLPAIFTVAFGALAGENFELVEHHDYFGLIQIIIVLFVAAMASDLVGNDRKNNTLPLYFSRPIKRDDYLLAKIAALATALMSLTLVPQLLVFIGNWLGASDGPGWLGDNISDIWRIGATSTLASVQLAVIGLAIAMFTTRRAFALISVLAALWFSVVFTGVLVAFVGPGWAAVAMLATPLYVTGAATYVIFDAVPARGDQAGEMADQVAYADLPGWTWIAALVAQTAVALFFAIRRYRKVTL
ncbi:MAG: ABC transporter permease subunit [Acidimicrobiales bacterium]|nr:ABC transporter permease subunit [Acidimicrobiales bacterium]